MIASLYAPKLAGAGVTTYAYAPVRMFALLTVCALLLQLAAASVTVKETAFPLFAFQAVRSPP